MMSTYFRMGLASAAASLLLVTTACKKDADETAMTPDTAATTAATGTVETPATALRVTEVDLGRSMKGDSAIDDKTDDFKPNDTIHALVTHEGMATDAKVTARWTYQDGQVVDERTETVSPTTEGKSYTHFMIQKASGWPKGKYTLHVLVNGNEVQTEEFEVN